MIKLQFLMVTDLSSSSKYCSIISVLDGSKQWQNYVIFMGSLSFFLFKIKKYMFSKVRETAFLLF